MMLCIVTLFLPVALFSLMASVNKYRDQGIDGGVDCDGPLSAMLFAVPSMLVYAAGAVYYAVRLKCARRILPAALLLVLCLGMALATGRKVLAAYREQIRPEYQQTCRYG
jgi:hypothetical protein